MASERMIYLSSFLFFFFASSSSSPSSSSSRGNVRIPLFKSVRYVSIIFRRIDETDVWKLRERVIYVRSETHRANTRARARAQPSAV